METFGKVVGVKGNLVTIELESDTDMRKIKRYGDGLTKVEIDDGRKRTIAQLHKAHALFDDIAKERYVTVPEVKDLMRAYYLVKYREEMPSESIANQTQQSQFIEVTLDFCFEQGIPFATKTWDAIQSDYGTQMRCFQYRECAICREHADYCHVETVGMGNNRSKINHEDHHFMSLCRKHHMEQHTKGINWFINQYHIKPLKLKPEQLVEFGIETYKTYSYYKEREQELILRGDVVK